MKYKYLLLFILSYIIVNPSYSNNNDPKASEESIVISGNARFTILTPELVRLEWSENSTFEDKASLVFINRKMPVVEFTADKKDGWIHIATSKLAISYKENSGKFSNENLQIKLKLNEETVTWKPGMVDNENLGGTARTLDGCVGGYDWDGNPVDLGQGILSRSGWSLIDDSKSHLFDGSEWNWVESRTDTTAQDWYFFGHGHNYKKALKDYTKVAGKIPMVPKYAFGYWWSRYWVYSDQELRELMNQFRSFDIPIDVLVIDMDWHETFGGLKDPMNPKMDETGHWLGWTGYTWNKSLFPNPERFLDWTNKNHLKTALNLHPASGIAPMEEQYNSFAKAFDFDTTGQKYIHYQMANKKWAQVYFDSVLQPMEQQGVDFWWLDWQQYPESKIVDGLSNTWWLNYTFYTDMEQRGTNRPLLFHRWGGMGNHRYQIGFSGDDRIDWRSLKYQTYFTPTASNVGYGYWSHDIGGHAASEYASDPELYVRWLQFGVFSPILRTHSAKISTIERRFWKYPNHFGMMKDLIHLRYSLVPYIYSAGYTAYTSGVSICRPMYYDYPSIDEAYDFKYQYMFGDDILVAPISDSISSKNNLANQTIWLLEGEWYDWYSGTLLEGGSTIERNFALDEIPLYIKAGSIIPMYPKISNLQESDNRYILAIVPGESGQTKIYEDDYSTNEYQQGLFAEIPVSHEKAATGQHHIKIEAVKGNYHGIDSTKKYEVRIIRSFPPQIVTVNGKQYAFSDEIKPGTYTYDGTTLTTNIILEESSIHEPIKIEVSYADKFSDYEHLLNGKAGQFRRLSQVVKDMKLEVARGNWWALMPEKVLEADRTPMAIQYNPEKVIEYLTKFESNYPLLGKDLLSHPDGRIEKVQVFINYLELN
jgi:alpha-glucosidase (family GH31 glycosyl hydrolase)